jgi:PAS domain S-box-containing protein
VERQSRLDWLKIRFWETVMLERMSEKIVRSMFETMPIEITIIDDNDEVVGWNHHETRIFRRPLTSMGLNFRQCHPEESLAKVEQIVGEMKTGTRDKATFWIDLPLGPSGEKHKMLIEFHALRDDDGTYLGCMECAQDVEEIRALEGEKRLLT